jgi:hypothetical protein
MLTPCETALLDELDAARSAYTGYRPTHDPMGHVVTFSPAGIVGETPELVWLGELACRRLRYETALDDLGAYLRDEATEIEADRGIWRLVEGRAVFAATNRGTAA